MPGRCANGWPTASGSSWSRLSLVAPAQALSARSPGRPGLSTRLSHLAATARWSNAPSHTTYKTRLTSKSAPPSMGLTGLLNLLRVGTRLQAAWDLGSQEGGGPCPSSPPPTQLAHPSLPPASPPSRAPAGPAVPPVPERGSADLLGAAARRQSPTPAAPPRSPRRASLVHGRRQPGQLRRGGAS